MSEGTTLQAAEEGDGPTDAIAAPSAGKAREEEEEEAAGLMSGVKAELIDWRRGARPAEFVFALLTIGLLSYSLGSSEWLCGASNAGKMVMVSVSTALEQGAPPSKLSTLCASASAQLSKGKDKDKASLGLPSHHAVACELADAGSGAAGYGGTALFLAFLLLGFIVASELASHGLLGDLQSKLPPGVPAAKLASAAPVALWSLVVLLTYLALLAFALNAPASLGGGPARLGYSYGLARLALLCGLGGAVTHLSLGQGVGEDIVVAMLDALLGHWSHLTRRQKVTQALLAVGLLCELLLWVRRVEYGGLLLAYGLWAFSHHYHDHLCVFCSLAILSMSTDALTLANDEMHTRALLVPLLTWVLLLSKLGAVSIMVYFKDAIL